MTLVAKLPHARWYVSALLILAASPIDGCGKGSLIRFLGTSGAAGASVFVDSRMVGTFTSRPSPSGDNPALSFEARIRPGPNQVMVVTVAGDTLSATVRPDDSGEIFVVPEKRLIDYR